MSVEREKARVRLLEEILAELKLLNDSLGGAFLPWLRNIHEELHQANLNLMMIQVGLMGPEEAERIRRRAEENPHAPLKEDSGKLPTGEKRLPKGRGFKPPEGLDNPSEGVF